MSGECTKFHVLGLGTALGIAFGVLFFVVGLLAITGYGHEFVSVMGSVYLGYSASFWGSILGFLWGFLDGFIIGVLTAYFYNYYCDYCHRK